MDTALYKNIYFLFENAKRRSLTHHDGHAVNIRRYARDRRRRVWDSVRTCLTDVDLLDTNPESSTRDLHVQCNTRPISVMIDNRFPAGPHVS